MIDRKPHLLRPLAAHLLPPPLAPTNPAKHLGIDLSSSRTVEEVRQALSAVLAAAARGESSPAEAASIARRACARLRAIRRSHTRGATERMAGFASAPPALLFCFRTTGCARARNGWTK
jgi:hypothetical protein